MTDQPLAQRPMTPLDQILTDASQPPSHESLETALANAVAGQQHMVTQFNKLIAYCRQLEGERAALQEAIQNERAVSAATIETLTREREALTLPNPPPPAGNGESVPVPTGQA